MSGWVDIDRLYDRQPDGKIGPRKEGVWCSIADCCRHCQTTEKPHEAFGLCRLCYVKWKRKTDPDWRDRKNRLHKLSTLRNAEAIEARDKARQHDPKRQEQRREISLRYQRKHAKWPLGAAVWHEFIPGRWIKGEILETNNSSALVQFATMSERVPFRKLSREAPAQVMEAA